MKKTLLYFFVTSLLFGFTSCKDDPDGPDPDVIWDFVNYSIEFDVSDRLLINDETSLSKIKITYNGKEFLYSKEESDRYMSRSKATFCFPLAVRAYNMERDNDKPNSTLGFGEFRPEHNYKNQKITIDWGNGRIDDVEFSIYITWKKGDPTVHRELKFNGEAVDFAPIFIP